jgi:phosphoketolase
MHRGGGQLPQRGADLSLREPVVAAEIDGQAHQASPVEPLGVGRAFNLIYVYMNWLIKKYDLDTIYMMDPGHEGRH